MSMSTEDLLFEQYKLLVASYSELSQKRFSADTFFATLLGSIIAIFNFLKSTGGRDLWVSFFALGVAISIVWSAILYRYYKTEKMKYNLLLDLETHLPRHIFTNPKKEVLSNEKLFTSVHLEVLLPASLIIVFLINFIAYFVT